MKKLLYFFMSVIVIVGNADAFILGFILKNESGVTFHKIWLSPSDVMKWNEETDSVSREYNGNTYTLPTGFSTLIRFDNASEYRRNCRYWDLRVYDGEGKHHEWSKIDLATVIEIIIDSDFVAHFVSP